MIPDQTKRRNPLKPVSRNPGSQLDPRLIELVKILARTAAQKDYNRILRQIDTPSKQRRHYEH